MAIKITVHTVAIQTLAPRDDLDLDFIFSDGWGSDRKCLVEKVIHWASRFFTARDRRFCHWWCLLVSTKV